MGAPLFPNPAVTSMQFQSGVFAFDNMAVNPYSVQQPFNIQYPPAAMSHPAPYSAPVEVVPTSPNTMEQQHANMRAAHRSPSVKSENRSPIQQQQNQSQNQNFSGAPGNYSEEYKSNNNSTDAEGGLVSFSTDVDTLMRAIQAKTKTTPSGQPEPETVRPATPALPPAPPVVPVAAAPAPPSTSGNKSRKRYHCTMPGCDKSFYQKTHLEIHMRAHTGIKPFVRFSPC